MRITPLLLKATRNRPRCRSNVRKIARTAALRFTVEVPRGQAHRDSPPPGKRRLPLRSSQLIFVRFIQTAASPANKGNQASTSFFSPCVSLVRINAKFVHQSLTFALAGARRKPHKWPISHGRSAVIRVASRNRPDPTSGRSCCDFGRRVHVPVSCGPPILRLELIRLTLSAGSARPSCYSPSDSRYGPKSRSIQAGGLAVALRRRDGIGLRLSRLECPSRSSCLLTSLAAEPSGHLSRAKTFSLRNPVHVTPVSRSGPGRAFVYRRRSAMRKWILTFVVTMLLTGEAARATTRKHHSHRPVRAHRNWDPGYTYNNPFGLPRGIHQRVRVR